MDNNDFETRRLRQRIKRQREELSGKTFATDPEAFKDLEGLKVRFLIAANPNHFAEKYARWAEERAARRARRAA